MDLMQIAQMTEDEARTQFEKIRWPSGPACVHCGDTNVIRLKGKSTRPGLLQCKGCRKQFTVTVKTIFEDSHIPLNKWFLAIHILCSSKKGFSALQLQRNLGLKSYKCAWHMAHRIRLAMKQGPLVELLKGKIEADETYVGGRVRGKACRGRSPKKKTPVMALVQRNGEVRTQVIANANTKTLHQMIKENVHPSSTIFTDEWMPYVGIGKHFEGGHKTVTHSRGEYVRGEAYTNTAECFFSLLKRGIMGQFHLVSKRHLHRYCDEFSFRWNHRKKSDFDRTLALIGQVEGKRLMYHEPSALSKA